MIKLIASDLDGTLLQNGAQCLDDGTIELIEQLLDKGITFVPASGRQYPNLKNLFKPLGDRISYICENGSLTICQGQVVSQKYIDREIGLNIIKKIMDRDGCEVLLSGMYTSYIQPKKVEFANHLQDVVKNTVTIVEDITKVEEPFLKISVYEEEGIRHSEEYWNQEFGDYVTVVTSGDLWLDTIPKGVNKGTAITELQQRLGILPEECIAIGDHYNDVEMLKAVKYSCAMNNAQPGIKELCRLTTDKAEHIMSRVLKGGIHD